MQTLFMIALCVAPSFATPDLNEDPRLNYSIVKIEYRSDVDTGLLGCKFISEQVNIQDQAPWEATDSGYSSTSPKLMVRSLEMPESEVDRAKLDEFDQLDDIEARSMFNIPLPENYDARLKYENCPSLSQVEDQGCGCSGSWAIAPASALSDRYCIYYNDGTTAKVSAENVLSCCSYCTHRLACEGGFSLMAWVYLQYTLVVSGGSYGNLECPKTIFTGKVRIDAGIAEGISIYNEGYMMTMSMLLEKSGVSPGIKTVDLAKKKDDVRLRLRKDRSTEKYKKYRKVLKYAKLKEEEHKKAMEGVTYEPGSF